MAHPQLPTIARPISDNEMLQLLSKTQAEFREEVNQHPGYTTAAARLVAVEAEEYSESSYWG